MHRQRQTKIVATLGPASNTKEKIRELFLAGVDVFRLNFSHGKHEDHKKVAGFIREIEKEFDRPVSIMADLQGPKLRIGVFENKTITLKKDQKIRFDLSSKPGNNTRVNLPHPEILKVLQKGNFIFLDDGKVRAKITAKGKDYVDAVIQTGATLSDKKGLNVPGVILPIPALTAKDKKDLKAALDIGVDWIAQSFVQKPEDAKAAKRLIGDRAALMVKLEKPSAIALLEEILDIADGIMLARGDLGVEIPPEDVPAVQKRVIKQARDRGMPVVVATQMLESMITNARPTRAEASDVATAVYDGADAVMLSAETAAGEYPIRSVEMMDKICRSTERDETYKEMMEAYHPDTLSNPSDAITTAAYYVAQDVNAKCIVTYTTSGSTALRMARQRPSIPVVCLTAKLDVARRLAVSYGVYAVHTSKLRGDFHGPVPLASRVIKRESLAKQGERFIMTAGVPFGKAGTTNLLRIAEVG